MCCRCPNLRRVLDFQEIQGGRSSIHGISDHLQDHSLQQFVNSLTNRPIQFGYEACDFEGKQIGIIRIALQRRPVFLKRNYGKLRKGEVYVRRGSSTDPTKPADPDEIAMMGGGHSFNENDAHLTVEFANTEREQSLGEEITWSAEFCEMPELNNIPEFDDFPPPIRRPDGQIFHIPKISSFNLDSRVNSQFFRQLANFTFFHKLFKKIRLVVANNGESPASDVRLEICIQGDSGVVVLDKSDTPDVPRQRLGLVVAPAFKRLKLRPALRHVGYVDIDKNDHETKIEIECGNLQPGRKVWTGAFFLGIGQSGNVKLSGHLFSGTLSAEAIHYFDFG